MYKSAWLTPEVEVFRKSVRRFIAEVITPHDEKWRAQKHIDRQVWEAAGRLGLLLPDVPEEYGGAGAGFAYEAAIHEELGRAGDSAFAKSVHSIAARYLTYYGTEAQKREWLPKMGTSDVIAGIALTEPGAGSDISGMQTTARREGDNYIIRGAKTFITNGHHADLLILAVKTDPAAGARATSLMLFDTRRTPGFKRGRMLDKIGMQGSDTCELHFDDCPVSPECILGGVEGMGSLQLMEQLPYERTLIAIKAMGVIEGALEQTIAYVKERTAFGKTIAEFQNTRFELAEMKTLAAVARTFVDRLICEQTAGQLDSVTASMAKSWMSDLQCEIVDRCLQLFGGYGYTMDYLIGRMYIDVRSQRICGGTSEIMKELIASSL